MSSLISRLNPQSVPIFILAGGLGTRLSEETDLKPKPMVEVGQIPILVHLMRFYYKQGFNDFVICAGYRSWEIKNYFLNYEFRSHHLQIDHRTSAHEPPSAFAGGEVPEKWRVRVIDTGVDCMTGGRIARAFDLVSATQQIETFGVTYGDGLCDVPLIEELGFHNQHGKIGTVLGVRPPSRFGELNVNTNGDVESFLEKPESKEVLINGGFFFFQKQFREFLVPEKSCILERTPLETLAKKGGLKAYPHFGFWHPMDTLRDKTYLQHLWDTGKAPWVG